LNIIARGRWVWPYLGYYLSFVEDDRRGVLENNPLPHYFITREEEFFKMDAVVFERLVTLLHQGVEGRLDDVVLVEVGSVGATVSTLHA
jgi:hypothetical protein